jgi:alpha-glucosidase
VASQERDPRSLLILHRRLITLRRAEPALREGLQTQLQRRGELLFFRRELQDRCLVVLNMSGGDQLFTFRELGSDARVLLSTSLDRDDELCRQEVRLRGHEGLIMRLT